MSTPGTHRHLSTQALASINKERWDERFTLGRLPERRIGLLEEHPHEKVMRSLTALGDLPLWAYENGEPHPEEIRAREQAHNRPASAMPPSTPRKSGSSRYGMRSARVSGSRSGQSSLVSSPRGKRTGGIASSLDINPYDPASRQRAPQSGCSECPHCLRAAHARATCDLGKGFGRMARVHDAAEKRAQRLSKASERAAKRKDEALEAVRAEQRGIKSRMDSKMATLQERVAASLSSRGLELKDVDIDLRQRQFIMKREILFESGSCEFSEPDEAHGLLDEVAEAFDTCNVELSKLDETPVQLCVEGHTEGDNMDLSTKRAKTCKAYLAKKLCSLCKNMEPELADFLIMSVGHSNKDGSKRSVMMRVVVDGDAGEEGSEEAWREKPEHLQTPAQQAAISAEADSVKISVAASEANAHLVETAEAAEAELAAEQQEVKTALMDVEKVKVQMMALEVGHGLVAELDRLAALLQSKEDGAQQKELRAIEALEKAKAEKVRIEQQRKECATASEDAEKKIRAAEALATSKAEDKLEYVRQAKALKALKREADLSVESAKIHQIKAEEAARDLAKAKKELETTQAVQRNAEALGAAAREKRDQVKKEIKAEREAHLSYMHDQKQLLDGQAAAREAAVKAGKELEAMRRAKAEGEHKVKELQDRIAALKKEHGEALSTQRERVEREIAEFQERATAVLSSSAGSVSDRKTLEKVELDVPGRRINIKHAIAFKDGVTAFSETASASATLDAVAAALDACVTEAERRGMKPVLLSIEAHTADEDPALSAKRAAACRDHVAKKLSELRSDASPADIQKLLQTIGHGNKVQKKEEVVMRIVLNSDEDGN